MNKSTELLVTELSKTVGLINNGAKTISGDVYSQIPDICHQIVVSEMIRSITSTAMCFLAITVVGFFIVRLFKIARLEKIEKPNADFDGHYILAGTLCLILFVPICGLATNINSMIKCKYAPKMIVIEYLRSENDK